MISKPSQREKRAIARSCKPKKVLVCIKIVWKISPVAIKVIKPAFHGFHQYRSRSIISNPFPAPCSHFHKEMHLLRRYWHAMLKDVSYQIRPRKTLQFNVIVHHRNQCGTTRERSCTMRCGVSRMIMPAALLPTIQLPITA